MTQWRKMTAAEGAASRQQADAGYRKIPLRAQAGEYWEGAQRKCVQNETTLQLWTAQKTRRRLVHFGASVLVPLPSLCLYLVLLPLALLFLFLLRLQCAWSSRHNPAKGQA